MNLQESIRNDLDKLKEMQKDYRDEDEGVSAEDLVDIITHRIKQDNDLMLKLLGDEGPEPLMNAIENVAEFYSGTTEVGSSDVSAMVSAVEKSLA